MDENSVEFDIDKIVASWLKRLYIASNAHFDAAMWYERRHFKLGILTITLSTIVGTAVFAAIQKQPQLSVQIFVGLLSILAAVFSAVQTFTRFDERAAKHKATAARFGSLIRELEGALITQMKDREEINAFISRFGEKYDFFNEEAPSLTQDIWKKSLMTSVSLYHLTRGEADDVAMEFINEMRKKIKANKTLQADPES